MARRKNNREKGSSIFESMAALLILCLLFFGMLQVCHWTIQKLICEYAAFNASKSASLGFLNYFSWRTMRVSAIGVSGERRGRTGLSERDAAMEYMTTGDASGVYYSYWYPQRSNDPELHLSGTYRSDEATANVTVWNAPLLHPNLARLLGIAEAPEPSGSVRTYNYSKLYLEE